MNSFRSWSQVLYQFGLCCLPFGHKDENGVCNGVVTIVLRPCPQRVDSDSTLGSTRGNLVRRMKLISAVEFVARASHLQFGFTKLFPTIVPCGQRLEQKARNVATPPGAKRMDELWSQSEQSACSRALKDTISWCMFRDSMFSQVRRGERKHGQSSWLSPRGLDRRSSYTMISNPVETTREIEARNLEIGRGNLFCRSRGRGRRIFSRFFCSPLAVLGALGALGAWGFKGSSVVVSFRIWVPRIARVSTWRGKWSLLTKRLGRLRVLRLVSCYSSISVHLCETRSRWREPLIHDWRIRCCGAFSAGTG